MLFVYILLFYICPVLWTQKKDLYFCPVSAWSLLLQCNRESGAVLKPGFLTNYQH